MGNVKPARRIAIHEAGHALAYWWNGQTIYGAMARTKAEMIAGPAISRRGSALDVSGVVEAANFIAAPSLVTPEQAEHMALLPELVARDLLHCYAGPVAEAIYRRASFGNVLLGVGHGDLRQADELLELLPGPDRDEADHRALARSGRLVRRCWLAVTALADLLQERGTVDGGDVEALFCAVTGESPEWRSNDLSSLDKRGRRHE